MTKPVKSRITIKLGIINIILKLYYYIDLLGCILVIYESLKEKQLFEYHDW